MFTSVLWKNQKRTGYWVWSHSLLWKNSALSGCNITALLRELNLQQMKLRTGISSNPMEFSCEQRVMHKMPWPLFVER